MLHILLLHSGMEWIYLILGIVLILMVVLDLAYNTLNILIARRAISGYLRTLKSSFIKADDVAPPEPDFNELEKLQQYIEKDNSDIKKEYVRLDNRRRLLKGR